jgi:hypothetical protein
MRSFSGQAQVLLSPSQQHLLSRTRTLAGRPLFMFLNFESMTEE